GNACAVPVLANADERPAVLKFRRRIHNDKRYKIAVGIRLVNPKVPSKTGIAGNGLCIGSLETGKLSDPGSQHLQAFVHGSGGYPEVVSALRVNVNEP
ncbi:hypothetical protein LCGC14_1362910, partial [marine sediment metagenome]